MLVKGNQPSLVQHLGRTYTALQNEHPVLFS
jgi:hypothetical protein